jgi:hypothetical protein
MSTNSYDPDRDVRLSAAYRDLEDARTPAHLDEQVMRMAAREARTGYGLARAWTRPLAWAAVVVLCLTYALELTRVDDVSDATQYMVTPTSPAESPEPLRPAASPARLKRSQTPEKAEFSGTFAPAAAVSEKANLVAGDRGRAEAEPPADCDATERSNPDDWYACIRRLQDDERAEAAGRELEALRHAFPDYSIPSAHK